jgi:hypothetical protein
MLKDYQVLYDQIIDPYCKIEALHGILFFGTTAMASDNYMLVALQARFPEAYKGQIVASDGKFIYSDDMYRNAISELEKAAPRIKENGLSTLNLCSDPVPLLKSACKLLPVTDDSNGGRVCIDISGICVYPPRLLKALGIFEAIEETPDIYGYAGSDEKDIRLVLKSESCTILIAPVYFPEGYHPNRVTAEEALKVGDLL